MFNLSSNPFLLKSKICKWFILSALGKKVQDVLSDEICTNIFHEHTIYSCVTNKLFQNTAWKISISQFLMIRNLRVAWVVLAQSQEIAGKLLARGRLAWGNIISELIHMDADRPVSWYWLETSAPHHLSLSMGFLRVFMIWQLPSHRASDPREYMRVTKT